MTGKMSQLTILILCLVTGSANAQLGGDDCTFGNCYLLREAVRERDELLESHRRNHEARERQRSEEQRADEDRLQSQQAVRAAVEASSGSTDNAVPDKKTEKTVTASKMAKKVEVAPTTGRRPPKKSV